MTIPPLVPIVGPIVMGLLCLFAAAIGVVMMIDGFVPGVLLILLALFMGALAFDVFRDEW